MPDRPLPLRRLIKILSRFDVAWDASSGKGSHGIFRKTVEDQALTFPVPTASKELSSRYVREARKKFKLTEADGVSDAKFYRGKH